MLLVVILLAMLHELLLAVLHGDFFLPAILDEILLYEFVMAMLDAYLLLVMVC